MAHDDRRSLAEKLQQVLELQVKSLSLMHDTMMRLDRIERSQDNQISLATSPTKFELPHPPNKAEPPLVPEGLCVICIRCGYRWLPREDPRPKRCPSCKGPWWYPILYRWVRRSENP